MKSFHALYICVNIFVEQTIRENKIHEFLRANISHQRFNDSRVQAQCVFMATMSIISLKSGRY